MPRFAVNISEQDFREKLVKALIKCPDFEEEPGDVNPQNILDHVQSYLIVNLTEKVRKDLGKVQFDCENVHCKGFAALPNGLLILPFEAGGDWENPIAFVIYFDGKEFRGYIPSDGNHYNRKTKTAFGNDEDSDAEQGYDSGDYEAHRVEWDKVAEDCARRIQIKG